MSNHYVASSEALVTALASTDIKPGDTLKLHGGTYTGDFTSSLTGTPAAPIVVRSVPGERARIDGNLTLRGADTWYRDFEVLNSDPARVSAMAGSNPTDIPREATAVHIFGPRVKCINLVVHDLGGGFGFWTPAVDAEIYGCIIFNNGWDGPAGDRGHGHGVYVQNQTGTKRMLDNILFNQFGYGFHAYTEGAYIDNLHFEGNVTFHSGRLSVVAPYQANFLLAGGANVPQNPAVINNCFYDPWRVGGGVQIGQGTDNAYANLLCTGNYIAGADLSLKFGAGGINPVYTAPAEFNGNTITGYVVGLGANARVSYPDNTYWWNVKPTPLVNAVFVRPNAYEPGRAHVVVYNWLNLDSVDVVLSNSGLSVGESFEVIDVQDYFGAPAFSGIWDGNPVNLPMTRTAVTQPIGNAPVPAVHTSKEFGVFLVRPVSGPITPPPSIIMQELTFFNIAIPSGQRRTYNVFLTEPAPTDGVVVALESSRPEVLSVPLSITIKAGKVQGAFEAIASLVTAKTQVSVTGYSGDLTPAVAKFWVNP